MLYVIVSLMELVGFIKELKQWINEDPFREAVLISETPIKPSTLIQVKGGTHKPSPRLVNAMKAVMAKHPFGTKDNPAPSKAVAG